MLRVRTGNWKVVHEYGHNSVPHNVEAVRLAKAGAKLSIVRKIKRHGRSHELQSKRRKQKSNRGRGIKRHMAV